MPYSHIPVYVPVDAASVSMGTNNGVRDSCVNGALTEVAVYPTFDPYFGSNVRNILFENLDNISASLIVDEIRTSIDNYEPRVELLSVEVNPDFEGNSYDVAIVYNIIGADIPSQELQFALEATR